MCTNTPYIQNTDHPLPPGIIQHYSVQSCRSSNSNCNDAQCAMHNSTPPQHWTKPIQVNKHARAIRNKRS